MVGHEQWESSLPTFRLVSLLVFADEESEVSFRRCKKFQLVKLLSMENRIEHIRIKLP